MLPVVAATLVEYRLPDTPLVPAPTRRIGGTSGTIGTVQSVRITEETPSPPSSAGLPVEAETLGSGKTSMRPM
ncbi:hypothetical protein GZL_09304 [Streptomyces sp. 769]|nr:hypothetical protein GZL_00109 [Streptomyces sp. 769]AJC61822.1 hypothetical protein GZL_09304 [Streptomyces sp. 769]